MQYIAALLANGKVFTGSNHGEAFGKLTVDEQEGEIESGFFDVATGTFLGDHGDYFLKQMYLVRHGETKSDHWDADISPVGLLQAHQAADYFSRLDLSEFQGYVSPYWRCLQTADIIFKKTGLGFSVLPEVREKGDREESIQSRKMDFPHFSWPEEVDWTFPQEQCGGFLKRIKSVLQQISARGLVVSHCDFIVNLTQMAVNNPPETWEPLLGGSITCIQERKLVCLGLHTAEQETLCH